jgi:hypothetical protein
VLSVPIPGHANVIETKTFKNNVPGGNAATDLKITSNRHPFAARSDKFEFDTITGNDIAFRSGSVAQGASTTVTISYAGNDKVVKSSASFSFAMGPDVPITSPIVGEFGGQVPIGTGFNGLIELSNDSGSPLFFTNFHAAVNVPAGFFNDIESAAALAVLTDNNLFISQGTPVSLPSAFSLAAGEIRDFNLGPMSGTDFIASFWDVGFSPTLTDTTFGFAVQGVIPEPSTFLLLASGLLALVRQLWKRGASL